MRTVTPAWNSAVGRAFTQMQRSAAYAPIVLLDFLTFQRVFTTRAFGTYEPEVMRLDQQGLSPLQIDLDESTGDVRLSALSLALVNAADLLASFAPGLIDNTRVQLKVVFQSLTPSDALTLFTGIVDRHQVTQEALQLALIDASFQLHRTLSVPIVGEYFPGAPQGSRNQNIPLVLGVAIDAPTIQVSGEAQGTLAFNLMPTATTLDLVEFGAPFPASGFLLVGTEGVAYTSRSLSSQLGVTVLRLAGLTRGTPTSHAIGTAVQRTNVQYQYLIGYEISSLQTVRDNGVVVSPTEYTLSTVLADRPVSMLTFAAQRGTITVDINGANIDPTNLLSNGSFEAGTLAGWTLGAGATGTVGTILPGPLDGVYRASLTGGLGIDGDLWQDIVTEPGEQYHLSLSYQNEDSNLLTNGGFETGDLTGWTLNTSLNYGCTATVVQGFTADGRFALQIMPQPGALQYLVEWHQDVATTAGSSYTFAIQHVSQRISQFFGAGSSGVSSTTISSQVAIEIGTPESPSRYRTLLFLPFASMLFNGVLSEGSAAGYRKDTLTFATAAATTMTRVMFRVYGRGQSAPTGGGNILPPPCLIDALRLQLVSTLDSSRASFAIGTPAAPDIYWLQAFAESYVWTTAQTAFRATTALSRVTLRSRYTVVSRASFFDALAVRHVLSVHTGSGGQNPVEAIAYVIRTFTQAQIDTASFQTAYLARLAWTFGAVLTSAGESRALIQRMAQQCNCLALDTSEGTYKLVPLDVGRAMVWTFAPSNIVEGSFQRDAEPMDNVYTAIYVWFGANTGGGGQPGDFAGLTYATPLQTTHPTNISLVSLCQAALGIYGREHRLDYYAEFIQDFATANLLLEALVQRHAVRHTLLTLTTWLDAAVLELGDMVQVQHPTLPASGVQAEVVSWQTDFSQMTVTVTLRTWSSAGWEADFDFVLQVHTQDGWAALFENEP